MHSLLAPLALLAAQAAAAPADWQPLGASRGFNLSFDRAGAERTGDIVLVRLRRALPTASAGTPSYVSRVEIHCAGNVARVVETVSFRADGTISRTDTVPAPLDPIAPGGLFEIVRGQVC